MLTSESTTAKRIEELNALYSKKRVQSQKFLLMNYEDQPKRCAFVSFAGSSQGIVLKEFKKEYANSNEYGSNLSSYYFFHPNGPISKLGFALRGTQSYGPYKICRKKSAVIIKP